ncbi:MULTISPECIES: alpha/beta fold hydrolase [Paraburkholderia]|uniref:alpha/beta fold hydrolase n=1 Tax=Paraburkholderia TaxID=1822464 RepID=UPI0022533EDE|nr:MULTISPECIES: alpha/beta hydrolase [Paraburkholderia]MCX4165958.1 alpha/beta hydrolase [Paraburkholderia megapolitana]MDN7161449.1 alpha/beta hydrolase [Paraburkholderia sp. CHISQ3]MDQ6498496.1 alpha/beta hydrolase [Paraburkholderia megapolitana]
MPLPSNATTAATASEFATLPATATRDALRIEYRWLEASAPDAPLAVFLHEGAGSVATWRNWPHTLCARLGMRGLVYSRPGYGHSTPRPHAERWPIDFMHHQAHDVLPALLDALGVDTETRARMWVIGHSDGGSIALLYAAAFPAALAGAIAIAPHVFVEDVTIDGIREAKHLYETTDLRERLSRYHADVDSAFYGWNDIWLDPAFRAWNIVGRLSAIRCPLLAVQGHDDHYGTMAQIETIAAQVPQAQLAKLNDCGHSPHRDVPGALNDAIAAFVDTTRDS